MIAVLLALGALATGSQVLAMREFLVVFAGNELSLGLLFAAWFLGIASGAAIGGRLVDRLESAAAARSWLHGLGLIMVSALALVVILLRRWRSIWSIDPGTLPGMDLLGLSSLLLMFPLALAVGLAFPLACRAVREDSHDLTVGRVYVLESVGAILGGLLCTSMAALGRGGLVLVGALGLFMLLAISSALLEKKSSKALAAGAGLLALALLGFWTSGSLARWEERSTLARFHDLNAGAQRVGWAASPYQFLDLGRREGQFDLYADGKALTSFPDPYLQRPRAHLVMAQHPAPAQVLLFGSASFGALPALLAHPIQGLCLVELDAHTYELVKPSLAEAEIGALRDPRLRFVEDDPRRFVARSDERGTYDLVFVDAPEPLTTAGNRVFTLEFYQAVKRLMASDGVLATRLPGSASYLGVSRASLLQSGRDTLAQAFAEVLVVPGTEAFLFASDQASLSADPAVLARRHEARGVDDPHFSPRQFSQLVDAWRVEDLKAQLAARGRGQVNQDGLPASVAQGLAVWSERSDDTLGRGLAAANGWPGWIWYSALGLLLALTAWWIRRARGAQRRWRADLVAVAALGAAGMGMELLLTFAYQALSGSIYQELGLLVAAFMLGLVLAGWAIDRRLRRVPVDGSMLSLALVVLAVFAASLPLVQFGAFSLGGWAGRIVLLLAVALAGAGTGAIFPMLSQHGARAGQSLPTVAGGLDAADHLGAAVGAFAIGLLLLPSLGQAGSAAYLALALLGAAAALWSVERTA